MSFRWACNTCGQLHGTNPTKCRNCGASVFTPVSRDEVASQASNPRSVEAIDPDEITTYGKTPDPEFESSPDVNPDGSLSESSELDDEPIGAGGRRSVGKWVQWVLLLLAIAGGVYVLYF